MLKAAPTRALLQEHALVLFVQQRSSETTGAEIADSADLSEMAFFRYFSTNESAVFEDPCDPVIAGPTREGQIRLIAGHHRLAAGVRKKNRRTEDLTVAALAETGADRVDAKVAAGTSGG